MSINDICLISRIILNSLNLRVVFNINIKQTRNMQLRNGKIVGNSQMKTQTHKKPLYAFNIDFDYASRCWRLNKQAYGEGMFRYVPVKK